MDYSGLQSTVDLVFLIKGSKSLWKDLEHIAVGIKKSAAPLTRVLLQSILEGLDQGSIERNLQAREH